MERRRIIQRLLKKLNALDQAPVNEDYLFTASWFTGLHPKVLLELESKDEFDATIVPIDRSVIYEKLVDFYVTKNKVPSTYELYNSLIGHIPPYIDIENFRKILVKLDFVWKKESHKRAVVIEKPAVRFERYNYLKKIQLHRLTNTGIYYIDTGSYNSKGNYRDYKITRQLVVDEDNGWIQRVIYALGPNGIHALEEIEDFNCDTVEEWVRDSLMPRIDKPSVFVINNNEHYSRKLLETPTVHSLKSDMKLWLDKHEIPYDDNMSKYELFALAESASDLNNIFKIDEMLKCAGHSVLRIPKCIAYVTSAALLARIIDANFCKVIEESRFESREDSIVATKELFKELIVATGSMYINEFEKNISKNEIRLIELEEKVDNVYDMILAKAGSTKTKDGSCEDSDLPSCSDSE